MVSDDHPRSPTQKKPGSLQNAFEAIDLDESGAISFEEFKKCGWTALTWA